MIIRVDVLGITIYWKTCFYSTVRVHVHVSIYKKFFNFLYQSSLQYEIWKVLKIIRMEKKQTPYYKHFFNIKAPCKLILLQMDISKIKNFSWPFKLKGCDLLPCLMTSVQGSQGPSWQTSLQKCLPQFSCLSQTLEHLKISTLLHFMDWLN